MGAQQTLYQQSDIPAPAPVKSFRQLFCLSLDFGFFSLRQSLKYPTLASWFPPDPPPGFLLVLLVLLLVSSWSSSWSSLSSSWSSSWSSCPLGVGIAGVQHPAQPPGLCMTSAVVPCLYMRSWHGCSGWNLISTYLSGLSRGRVFEGPSCCPVIVVTCSVAAFLTRLPPLLVR